MVITYIEQYYGTTAGEVVNPAGGQLNRENEYFPFYPRSRLNFGLARRVQPSRSASVFSFSKFRLNLVL